MRGFGCNPAVKSRLSFRRASAWIVRNNIGARPTTTPDQGWSWHREDLDTLSRQGLYGGLILIKVNTIRVEQFYEILKLHSQIQGPAKPAVQVRLVSDACSQVGETSKLHAERISYSRDVLISLASSPMAKKKPNFLPEHPVVLENGREQDMQQLFMNNLHKEDV
ncbi:uncharacterized protein C8orf88 homolog isoform X1 [Trichomycterus rosablanca]|uniref:uncharacterized protein C8orf88 homolog isoform X1 n=1 Tax=Trichomycterus rosablanca TaxID=2290929 RepID=UPI002F35032D